MSGENPARSRLFLALIHHPVMDRHKKIITSSVTNLDLHDIARACLTFGIEKYFVVHPSHDEQALNRRILRHWESGYGKTAHPTRTSALHLVQLAYDFEEVVQDVRELTGMEPLKAGTHARPFGVEELRPEAVLQRTEGRPLILVFGTGYGLAPSWAEKLDIFVEPIYGVAEYNHLSVRSAVSIYLDRLLGSGRPQAIA